MRSTYTTCSGAKWCGGGVVGGGTGTAAELRRLWSDVSGGWAAATVGSMKASQGVGDTGNGS